ncbi:MAG: hypothetical protein IKX39_03070 [Muribaculaceae bacterium]|nr:hypothetical protein [Muribaculaceae bacterium]
MNGHIGSMLYQKSYDVFAVRQGNIEDFYFSIVDGKPSGYSTETAQKIEADLEKQRTRIPGEKASLTE